MQTSIIVRDIVGPVPYWASDETLPKARARFKRLTGKFPSKEASIMAFTGELEDLDKISIDDLGTINYPKNVTKVTIQ
jgi:hypothetical protein